MTTHYDGYNLPAFTILGIVEDGVLTSGIWDGASYDNTMPEPFVVEDGAELTLWPVWYSDQTGFQVQTRVRHRLNYASGLLEDDSGAEVWTDFPAWTEPSGPTTVARCEYTTSLGRSGTRWYAPGLSMTYTYDLSEYDLHEVEIRVRVYSTYYDRASDWVVGRCRIAFRPQLTSIDAETRANGGLYITYGSNWPRGTQLVIDSAYRDYTEDGPVYASIAKRTLDEGIATGFTPQWLIRDGSSRTGGLWPVHMLLVSEDTMAASGRDGGCSLVEHTPGYIIEPDAHVDPPDVPAPNVRVARDDGEVVAFAIGCACDHVVGHAEYTDADGNLHVTELEVGGSSPDWVAELVSPPYGVDIVFYLACCNASGEYVLASERLDIESDAHCSLDGDGDHVSLVYEGEFSMGTDLDGESVSVIGRKLPVSRHGIGVTRDLEVKGTIMFPSVFGCGDMELAGLSVLDNPHDWIFRNPKGMRKRVRVKSWNTDQGTDQLGRLAEVTIQMEEVDG